MRDWDFCGWATRNNVRCSDGRTILKDAFAHYDGKSVPLLWNHNHDTPECVLGHAVFENRDEGLYAYGYFNNSDAGKLGKELVQHGDVDALSIYANHLKQNGKQVVKGEVCELSLVHKGANPEAFIETVMMHNDNGEEEFEVNIFTGENIIVHADKDEKMEKPVENEEKKEDKMEESNMACNPDKKKLVHEDQSGSEPKGKTVQDVLDTMNEEQRNACYLLVEQALKDAGVELEEDDEQEEGETMKHNIFENETMENEGIVLSHADMEAIMSEAKRCGSLKEAFFAHADQTYGIDGVDLMFPDAQLVGEEPEVLRRDDSWVAEVTQGVKHSPFAKVKSLLANLTEEEARAKGYIKGKMKKEQVFPLLKRVTNPTTIYKKQKLDRDDIIDMKDWNGVVWLKKEMRWMLDEEAARAILIGDGREPSAEDKIDPERIRPIVNDADLYTIRWSVAGSNEDERAKNIIKAAIKARKNYKGSGKPVMFTTEDVLTNMLLLEDNVGHRLYKTEVELATALRVSKIVTVPPMEGFKDKDNKDVYAVIVNLSDYNVGTDRGGEVNFFDDFDIDFNQQKYLIETRYSGALVKPLSAIVLRSGEVTASEEPGMSIAFNTEKEKSA